MFNTMLKHSVSATRQGASSHLRARVGGSDLRMQERGICNKRNKNIPDWRMQSAIGQYVIEKFAFINYTVLGSFKKSISLFRLQR